MMENNHNQQIEKEKLEIVIYKGGTKNEQPDGHRPYRDPQVLKEKYESNGYRINRIYSDEGCNWDTLEGRPALQNLLDDALLGMFNVVLVSDVFSLTPNGEELLMIERKLSKCGVQLCSASEPFDTTTAEGRKHFYYMSTLLKYEPITCERDISLSALARLIVTKGNSVKDGEIWDVV